MSLSVDLDTTDVISESNETNNSRSVNIDFFEAAPICMRTYPIRTSAGAPDAEYLVTDPNGLRMQQRAESLLPTHNIRVYPRQRVLRKASVLSEWNPDIGLDGFDILARLWIKDQTSNDPSCCDDRRARTHYVGMILPAGIKANGLGNDCRVSLQDSMWFVTRTNVGNPVNSGATNDPQGGRTIAHELGHNYCRKHVNCSYGDNPVRTDANYPYNRCSFAGRGVRDHYGLDMFGVLDGSLNFTAFNQSHGNANPTVGDLMSYQCERWTSAYTWVNIMKRLVCQGVSGICVFNPPAPIVRGLADDGGGGGGGGILPPRPSGVLVVAGALVGEDFAFVNFHRLDSNLLPPAKLEELRVEGIESRGRLVVDIFDRNGVTLVAEDYDPATIGDSGDGSFFGFTVPWFTDTTSIRVSYAGRTEAAVVQPVSRTAPRVSVDVPAGGEHFRNEIPVAWSFRDDDVLSYTVQYSADNGETWETMVSDYLDTAVTLEADFLPASANVSLIRVIANDGVLTGSAISQPFTLEEHAPIVTIQAPLENSVHVEGGLIVALGEAFDAEDGPLEGLALRWRLHGNFVGRGEEHFLTRLEPGEHTLTLLADDNNEDTGMAEVTFFVAEDTGGEPKAFVRADANADRRIGIDDALATAFHLFSGSVILPCEKTADSDDNGQLDINDPLRTLRYLFLAQAPPPAPSQSCGFDPTDDGLSCLIFAPCE